MAEMLKVLSLGAGVQSSTVLLMSCAGVLPKLDAVIFADTQWESARVYDHLAFLEGSCRDAGIPSYRVTQGNLREDLLTLYPGCGKQAPSIPAYVRDGKQVGAVQRTCTTAYKVVPVERQIRELLGLKKGERWPTAPVVDLWFGISVDEQRRMRLPQERWKTHRYPLVFDLPKAYTRHDCLNWLQERGYPLPPRSACLGCPFHSNTEWRAVREHPEEWADVVDFDERFRHRPTVRGEQYLHRNAVPLVQIDFSTPEERGQGLLSFNEECLGYCGV